MAHIEIPEGLEELFEQTWFDHFLHYGLLVGAIFQLVCIAAIVVIPATPEEDAEVDASSLNGEGSSHRTGSSEATGEGAGGGGSVIGGGSKKSGKKARKRK